MRLHDCEEALALVVSTVAKSWARDGDFAIRGCRPAYNATTIFHAVSPPYVGVDEYVRRIMTFAGASRVVYVAALAYIARSVAGPLGAALQLTSYSVHRMLFTACVLATKYFDDYYMTNRYYADIGGLGLAEANQLELGMLRALSWNCSFTLEDLYNFEDTIITQACCSDIGPAVRLTLSKYGFRSKEVSCPTLNRTHSIGSTLGGYKCSSASSGDWTYNSFDQQNAATQYNSCSRLVSSGMVSSYVHPGMMGSASLCSNISFCSTSSADESDGYYSYFPRRKSQEERTSVPNDSAIIAWSHHTAAHYPPGRVYAPFPNMAKVPSGAISPVSPNSPLPADPPAQTVGPQMAWPMYGSYPWNKPWLPSLNYANLQYTAQAQATVSFPYVTAG